MSDEKIAKLDALSPFVSKVSNAFFESRWSAPKRYAVLTPYSFMLTDPSANELDIARLERLATDLKQRLFGASDAGDVTLLLHDGDDAATAKFVTMDNASLKKATQSPNTPLPFSGRVLKISTSNEAMTEPGWQRIDLIGTPAESNAGVFNATFHGVYFKVSQCFVGSGVSAPVASSPTQFNLFSGADFLPGERAIEFDLACLSAAARQLADPAWTGALFVPVSFSAVMRPATRETYAQAFEQLPPEKRFQLVAAVYDVPRMPARHNFAHLNDMLRPHFAQVDLQIIDPGFDVDGVPAGAVNTITLRLPDANDMVRASAIQRFFEKKQSFKRLNIGPAVTNVRSRKELDDCLRQPITYISGRAVCSPLDRPVGRVTREPGALPLLTA